MRYRRPVERLGRIHARVVRNSDEGYNDKERLE